MIQEYANKFIGKKEQTLRELMEIPPEGYDDLVKRALLIIQSDDVYGGPDPNRIHVIDDGDYQGTKLYVIAEKGYQPSKYYTIFVGYGSCSGCDTFEAIREYDDKYNEKQANEYWTLMLHMVQNLIVIEY